MIIYTNLIFLKIILSYDPLFNIMKYLLIFLILFDTSQGDYIFNTIFLFEIIFSSNDIKNDTNRLLN